MFLRAFLHGDVELERPPTDPSIETAETEASSLIRPADCEGPQCPKKDLALSRSRSSGDVGSGVCKARLPA